MAIRAQQINDMQPPMRWKDPRDQGALPDFASALPSPDHHGISHHDHDKHLAKEYSPAMTSSSSDDHGISHDDHDKHHAKEYSPAMT